MGFWDKLRGKGGDGDGRSAAAKLLEVRWLRPGESPFGTQTLDLRPLTAGTLSATTDPENASRAVSWNAATAKSIPSVEMDGARSLRCSLDYAIGPAFPDGLLFAPRVMEEKWALFHRAGSIIAVRSWTSRVVAVARGTRSGERLVLEQITVAEEGLGPFEDQPAVFDWLVRTHALSQVLPLPVTPAELKMLGEEPVLAFNLFGRMAEFAASGFTPPTPPPLRVFGGVLQAVRGGDVERVRAELAEGADPNVPSPLGGYAALHVAMKLGDAEMMRALLAAKADPKLRTDRGMDPIGLGIVQGAPVPILEELVAAGGALEGPNVDGFGLLHAAAEANRPDVVAWLAAHGLDREARTERGLTPLHIACGLGHAAAARALIAAGAEAGAASPLGTPREIAEREGHAPVAALFRAPARE